MVRIGGSTEKGEHIKEQQYYTPSGEFRVDAEGSPTLLNCLMYKLCYYRFGQVYTEGGENITSVTLSGQIFLSTSLASCLRETHRLRPGPQRRDRQQGLRVGGDGGGVHDGALDRADIQGEGHAQQGSVGHAPSAQRAEEAENTANASIFIHSPSCTFQEVCGDALGHYSAY